MKKDSLIAATLTSLGILVVTICLQMVTQFPQQFFEPTASVAGSGPAHNPPAEPLAQDSANRFRAYLARLSDEELFGRKHSLSAGNKNLQHMITRRLANGDPPQCPG